MPTIVARSAVAAAALWLAAALPATGAQPAARLLPATTTGYISVPAVERLTERWKETQYGQLMQDEAMKPFAEDLRRQFGDKWSKITDKLAMTSEDVEGIAGGELCVAAIRASADRSATVLLVDVTERMEKANSLLAKVDETLLEQKATKETAEVLGASVTTYTLPKPANRSRTRQAVFFINDNLLCGTDDPVVAREILGRFSGEPTDNLDSLPAFRAIMERVVAGPTYADLQPEIKWFVDPFGYAETVRTAVLDGKKKKGKDLVKILGEQGFSAIRGIGGYVNLSVDGRYELMHRTAIYAPPAEGRAEGQRFLLAARMLRFQNGENLTPQDWVPRDLATYLTLNWKLREAFEYVGTLVDAVVGDPGVWEDVIKSIREDPNGPQIDLRTDLVAYLGTRVTSITDYELPVSPKCERMLLAIEATDVEKLAATIDKTMETNPDAHRREFEGHVIWEVVDEPVQELELEIEGLDLDPLGGDDPPEKDAEKEKRVLRNSAVCVANGHLFVANHIDLLKKVLVQADERDTLANSSDYRLVMAELEKLTPGERCIRHFSRMDEEFRPTYELLRQGKMPEAETSLGKLLNAILDEGEEDELRQQKVDGQALPDYEMVRRYLGPAGLSVKAEPNGWYLQGIAISKETP